MRSNKYGRTSRSEIDLLVYDNAVIVTLIPLIFQINCFIFYYAMFSEITSFLDTCLICALFYGLIAASIASRPGQSGRADGYILEGKELEFYLRKIKSKKTK